MVNALWFGFLIFVGAERLFELWLSRRNARLAFAQGAVEAGQAHFRVMALVHTLFLFACAAEVLLLHRAFPGALGWAALGVAALAQGLRYWAIATLGSRWNVRVIVLPGAPPVTKGPYRLVRHPNYVAVVLELIAIPLAHGAWITALVFSAANAALLAVRIRVEERAMGPQYGAAFAERPRFVPRIGGTNG
jgi:methyltransferase